MFRLKITFFSFCGHNNVAISFLQLINCFSLILSWDLIHRGGTEKYFKSIFSALILVLTNTSILARYVRSSKSYLPKCSNQVESATKPRDFELTTARESKTSLTTKVIHHKHIYKNKLQSKSKRTWRFKISSWGSELTKSFWFSKKIFT